MRRQPQWARPTRRGQTHDTEIPANQVAAGGPLPPGADRRHERQRHPAFVLQVAPTVAGATSQVPPIQGGLARVWFLRQFEPGESLAAPIISANAAPVGQSLPGTAFLRDFSPGTYTFTVPSFGVDTGQAATVQLAAGTQTFLEVQSLSSWAGAGGDHFQRDTLYVRPISAYWAEKYFPTLTYLGPR
jgi:hypothetical protein